jgi:acyl dehydratase
MTELVSTDRHRFPLITEEALDELRARIGQPFARPRPHVTQATLDSIRHWALGIGDDNPLYLDPEYAAGTKWEGIIAPGTFLYAFDRVVSGYVSGLPGVHAMFAGTDWNWHQPIRLGDTITAEPSLKDLRDLTSQFSGRSIKQTYRVAFYNQNNELVCEADSWCIRTQRDVAAERAAREIVTPTVWTESEIAEIAEQYRNQTPQGSKPQYWDDVNEGDTLPALLKGPSTVTSFVCFTQGWGSLYVKAHAQAFEMFDNHPALGIPNDLGVPEPPERVHWDSDLARAVGVPAAYDYGPERVSWLGHLMTNWIGDDGFLKRLNVQVRKHNIVGDLTTCEGTVTRKWQEGDEHLVEVAVQGRNQRGEQTAVGIAVAVLPTRD